MEERWRYDGIASSRGLLIAIEGPDAAGKATQAIMLAHKLTESGRAPVLYSFPRYNTVLGKSILRHLHSETMLVEGNAMRAPEDPLWFQCAMILDRCEAVSEIRAHLAAGRSVICDRWKASAVAFGAADGLDVNWLERAQEVLPTAHLNIYVQVAEEESLRRRPKLRDRHETDREKQRIVRLNYERLWAGRSNDMTEPNLWVVIDGEGSTDVVHARIWEQVANAAVTMGALPP